LLGGAAVTAGVAKASAAVVARAIVQTRMASLEGHALGEIQNWQNRDEVIVARLRQELRDGGTASPGPGTFAAHAVAAGVYEAVAGTSTPAAVMKRMVAVLAGMHAQNPEWKPSRSPGGVRTTYG
jgi:hypothetical protein